MYSILFHPLILMNMLGTERMVLTQDHTYAEQDHRYGYHAYGQQYRFHNLFLFMMVGFTIQDRHRTVQLLHHKEPHHLMGERHLTQTHHPCRTVIYGL